MKVEQDHIVMSRKYGGQEGDSCHGCCKGTPYACLDHMVGFA